MHLNTALFQLNGGCGYVLKPPSLRRGTELPNMEGGTSPPPEDAVKTDETSHNDASPAAAEGALGNRRGSIAHRKGGGATSPGEEEVM